MKNHKYRLNDKSGLILEGGGMRGVFTSGVLDNLMDRGIRFPYTIGVSAGACNGLSYMSEQRGRAKYSNIDLLKKYNYIGIKHLITKGNIMDFDLLFDEFPKKIIPYNYEAYSQCNERFEMVTTNCNTGKACYYEEKNGPERIIDIVKASSSLPFVAPISYVDGKYNLSTVVTHKTSDWSVIELDKPVDFIWIKAVRRLDAVEIFYSFDDKEYTMMRNCWLQDNTPVMVGMMAASPDGNGFIATFEEFKIKHLPDQRRLEWLKKNQE